MVRTARCPSCGAPVEFRSIASVLAVCDYCQSTLVRDGEELKNLGRMAAPLEDRSPLQRGAEGRWRGVHFAIVGRIQYRYDAGTWNEWHLLFDNGRSGWLSEAGGEYVVSLPQRVTEELPRFDALHVGETLAFGEASWQLTNILSAECIAGEGELPFVVGAGYPAPVVDLRNAAGGFATLDYSDNPARPVVYIGESVDFKSLDWANLREKLPAAAIDTQARVFNCPSCGAPVTVRHTATVSMGCASCGAVLETAQDAIALIAHAEAQVGAVPYVALGSRGSLRGQEVEVIGYMARRTQGDDTIYTWNEWVLLGPDNGLLWLTEFDGHWNLGRVLPQALKDLGGRVVLDKTEYKHFLTYGSAVDFVIGEFPWQVRLDETAVVEDFVAPPRMLSHEVTDREESWTLLEYVAADEVRLAFAPERPLPEPRGVYANQPNPHEASHRAVCGRFWKFFWIALVVHLGLLAWGPGRTLAEDALTFRADEEEPLMTREFRLDRPAPRLDVEHAADLHDNWLALGVTLVNKETGQAWQATRELSRYSGVDEDGPWSEGSATDELTFVELPAGTYVIAEEAELDRASPPVPTRVKVTRAGPRWSSLFLLLAGLALFPIYTRIRRGSFEVSRWADSDHPVITASESDDD